MVRPREEAVRRADRRTLAVTGRLQDDEQRAVARGRLRRFGSDLPDQGFAEQVEEELEGVRVELADLREPEALVGGQALPGGGDLLGLGGGHLGEEAFFR